MSTPGVVEPATWIGTKHTVVDGHEAFPAHVSAVLCPDSTGSAPSVELSDQVDPLVVVYQTFEPVPVDAQQFDVLAQVTHLNGVVMLVASVAVQL